MPAEQSSVPENVYRLHYSFFKGKGQNILPVSFSFDVIIYFNVVFQNFPLLEVLIINC